LLNTVMGLLPVSTLTPGHFGTVTGSRASLHANVKSKAVSSPVRSSACIPKGNANASHNPYSRVSPLKRPQDGPPGAVCLFLLLDSVDHVARKKDQIAEQKQAEGVRAPTRN
jgi:hypothetical protein